jgi:beta-N-acetylhexosaminidase
VIRPYRGASVTLFVSALISAGCSPALSPANAPAHDAQPVVPMLHESEVATPTLHAAGALPAHAREWVDATLGSLSLRERVAQLIMPWVGGEYAAQDSPEFDELRRWVEVDRVGGLIISVGMPHSYAAKLNAAQRMAGVPLLVAADMENGPGMRMGGIYSLPHLLPQGGGTTFPSLMAFGAAGSDSLAYELGRILGREARAVGVHLTFGPVLDVNSNPTNPIINTRSFGEDPALVSRLATAYIRGARDAGLMTTGKHFPGHGDTEVDSHIDLPFIGATRERLDRVELPPFRAAVEAGVDAMMTAHIAMTGIEGPNAAPATLSPEFGVRLLRDEMGFGGLLFTDAMDMGAITRRYGTAEPLILALEAGADVLLMPIGVTAAIETVVAAVESGRIPASRIDLSARRVLEAKARLELHRMREVDFRAVDRVVGTRAHRRVAREVAERSITLARDDRGLLPFDASVRRVLSVTYAEIADPVAGRAVDRALSDAAIEVESVRVDDRTTEAEFAALRARAAGFDRVLVGAYVSWRESRGTVETRAAFGQFVEQLAGAGVPVVAVSFGSPYLLTSFPGVPTYVLAWGGAEVSQRAAVRALRGEVPITGTMPVSVPPHLDVGAGLRRTAVAAAEGDR